MTRLRTITAVLMLAAASEACRDPAAPASDDISVWATAEGLVIVNSTAEPIYSMQIDAGTLALVDFALCSRNCPVQHPAERRVVPWSAILGYSAARNEYRVLWAHATASADGMVQLGPMHTVSVTR